MLPRVNSAFYPQRDGTRNESEEHAGLCLVLLTGSVAAPWLKVIVRYREQCNNGRR